MAHRPQRPVLHARSRGRHIRTQIDTPDLRRGRGVLGDAADGGARPHWIDRSVRVLASSRTSPRRSSPPRVKVEEPCWVHDGDPTDADPLIGPASQSTICPVSFDGDQRRAHTDLPLVDRFPWHRERA